ncbi:MAG TPA: hypothetical protein V6C72_18510, partial [Chroococcales cyanobacterium]
MPLRSLIVALSVPICLAAFTATTSGAPSRMTDQAMIKKAFVSMPKSSHLTPTQSGVKLLEDILQRLHEAPQLAMTRAKQAIAYQQATNAPAFAKNGPTDPFLAIKPKEKREKKSADLEYDRKSLIADVSGADKDASIQTQNEFRQSYNANGVTEYPVRGTLAANSVSGAPNTGGYSTGIASGSLGFGKAHARSSITSADNKSEPLLRDQRVAEVSRRVDALKAKSARLSPESEKRLSNSLGRLYGVNQQLAMQMQAADDALSQKSDGARALDKGAARGAINIADASSVIKEYNARSS